jgi:transcriptional regulator with XRE-family HTH domain
MRPPKRVARQFGLAVKQLRIKRHLTQQELADSCGLDIGYVGGIERGQRNPTLGVIQSLASVLRAKPSELLRLAKL